MNPQVSCGLANACHPIHIVQGCHLGVPSSSVPCILITKNWPAWFFATCGPGLKCFEIHCAELLWNLDLLPQALGVPVFTLSCESIAQSSFQGIQSGVCLIRETSFLLFPHTGLIDMHA